MKTILTACVTMAAACAFAYQVSVGTYVSNAGRHVTVPVSLDSAAGLSYATATITYDPQVLVVTKAEAGTLRDVMSDDFLAVDTNGTLTVSIYSSTNVMEASGTIANVTFAVREGTAGLYSDLAISDVQLGEITGVKDVTSENPITTGSGMVRVVASNATVGRLEGAQTICADTALGTLELTAGDAIQASDMQTAINVAGAVTGATSAIPVKAPANGWASGTYALVRTTASGLTFILDGMTGEFSSTTANGMTTYYATVAVEGEIPVVAAGGETLSAGAQNQIRANARLVFAGKDDAASLARKALYESASKIEVAGPAGSVALIADMGLAPAFPAALDGTGTLRLTYAMPTLRITSFDPATGAVRFKVTPGEGNTIVSEIATGYIHVYGTDNILEKMRYVSSVGFDLTPYLKESTKGEGVLNVTLGTHTFLKIKVEQEAKTDGQLEP